MPAVQWTNSTQSRVFYFFESRGHFELTALNTPGWFPLLHPGILARMEAPVSIGVPFCFSYSSSDGLLYRSRSLIVPMWAPTLATLALPILWIVKVRQRPQRR
jgi:hypothetical protein